MLIPETSSPVAELTLDANPAAHLTYIYCLKLTLKIQIRFGSKMPDYAADN